MLLPPLYLFSSAILFNKSRARPIFDLHTPTFFPQFSAPFPLPSAPMKQFTPEQKHEILTHLRTRSCTQSVDSIAAVHGVKGGRRTLNLWLRRWNGTPQSLQHRHAKGRPRVLSRAEVSRHVRAPILAANRAHRPVHYSSLRSSVRAKTGKEVSVQTLRRYGKEELGGKQMHTKKRTREESECTERGEREGEGVHGELWTDFALQCPLASVSRSPT